MAELNDTRSKDLLARLRSAQYYAFDLDDTLHSFRLASSTATASVLTTLHSRTTHPLASLKNEYKRVLANGTASAFTDGKTSHQYRAERFQHLAQHFNIALTEGDLQQLVDLYEKTLIENLQLKPGVKNLFCTLKRFGYRITVITEGPQDAQERTVEALGIAPYIDYLANTNKMGVAKVDGLFERVLEHLGVEGKDVVMVGDSWERDIVPAMRAGIYSFHYDEKGGEAVNKDDVMRIRGLGELQALVERAYCEAEV